MTESKFEEIWLKVIKPTSDKIIAKHFGKVSFSKTAKQDIYSRYEEIRQESHSLMLDSDGRIDRHKISAAFVDATLRVSPFSRPVIDTKSEIKHLLSIHLVNELIAWMIGNSVIFSYIKDELQSVGLTEKHDIFCKTGLKLPKTKNETYQDHVLKNLYKSRYEGKFDLFSFAHIFFLLEEYTFKCYDIDASQLFK